MAIPGLARARPWSGADDPLVLAAVRDEAPGVKSFRFVAASGAPFRFAAGQHLVLDLPLPGGTVRRSFTIASPPTRPGHVELTVKAQGAGGATAWMHEALRPGARLVARGPGGGFHLPERLDRPLVLATAGSGATPAMAIARTLSDRREAVPVHYLHLARRSADLLFRAEVETIAVSLPAFTADFLVSAADPACGLPAGRPDAAALARAIPSLATAEVYACGPAGFMAAMRAAHAMAGGAPERFHTESFGGTDEAPAPAATAPASGFAVRVLPSGRELVAAPDESLLAALHRAGVALPSSCRSGLCGTCRILKRAGEVEMNQNGGLFDDEVEDGLILACCSRARSPLTLEIAK